MMNKLFSQTIKRNGLVKALLCLSVCLALCFTLLPGTAQANGDTDITVYVTVSNQGAVAVGADDDATLMANVPITVPATDGAATVDAALTAAHEIYCPEGYEQARGSVKMLWGVSTTNTLFFVNGEGLSTSVAVDTLSDGDYLTASINKDAVYYADWYSGFDAHSLTVLAGADFTLTLKGHLGMAWEDEDKLDVALGNMALGTSGDGEFTAMADKATDSDGKVTLSFAEPGVYVISAAGTVADIVTDWNLMDLGNGTNMYGTMDWETYDSFFAYTDDDYDDGPYPADEIKYVDFFEWQDSAQQDEYHVLHSNSIIADCPIIAPVCVVTVVSEPTLTLSVTEDGGDAIPADGYSYSIEAVEAETATVTALKVTSEADVDGGAYTYQWRYKTSPDATSSSLAPGNRTRAAYTPYSAGDTTDGVLYYYCKVTYKVNKVSYTAESELTPVTFIAGAVQTPVIITQPVGGTYLAGSHEVAALSVSASMSGSGALSYQWYASRDGGAYTAIAGAVAKDYTPFESKPCTLKLYCKVTNALDSVSGNSYSASVKSEPATVVFQSAAEYGVDWQGAGTAAAPYLLAEQADLVKLSELTAGGLTFKDTYFKMTADVTLPTDWTPVGAKVGKVVNPFSGCFDGGGFTLTVPEDGLPLLGYVRGATVRDLNIYGTKIASCGLVAYYSVDSGVTRTIDIINCTLKSGSSTRLSGFIGGYASGINTVTIRDCVVEDNVVVGYDKTDSNIGSFGGEFNGYVIGCVSYATVYGVNNVGGIVGSKGQSIGACDLHDCRFYGTVEASGSYAGGIVGAGYSSASAPQTPCVSIRNCLATGSVSGKTYVGGIFGGEGGVRETWSNGVGYIQNNLFTGTVSATETNGAAGGIVGYMRSLGRYNVISNNYYSAACGVSVGIGDANVTTLDAPAVKEGNGWTAINLAAGTVYGRGDDPLGAGAAALAKTCTTAELADGTVVRALNAGLNSSGDWVQGTGGPTFGGKRHLLTLTCSELSAMSGVFAYVNGDSVLTGKTLTLTYSDGSTQSLAATRAMLTPTITEDMAGSTIAASATYNNHALVFRLDLKAGGTVKPDTGSDKISVTFSLLGDALHGESGGTHTLKQGGLETWIVPYTVTTAADSTVMDVLAAALNAAEYSWMNADKKNSDAGNYIQSITTPDGELLSEFDNGALSGWMYTLNGKHPLLGVSQQTLSDGDVIVFHYTDDYTQEEGSEKWGGGGAAGVAGEAGQYVQVVSFPDVTAAHWAYGYINSLAARGVAGGYPDGCFYPNATIKRADLVVMLARLSGETLPAYNGRFTDVSADKYYAQAVAWAATAGVTIGDGQGRFQPEALISRQDMAAMLYRYADHMQLTLPVGSSAGFSDSAQIAAYAKTAVSAMYQAGVVGGYPDGSFKPAGNATRAEAAKMMYLLDAYK